MEREKESVVCRICGEEVFITENTLCNCGTRVFTSIELKHQLEEVNRKMANLRFNAMALSAELELRKTRKANFRESYLIKTSANPEEFFKNCHHAPKSAPKAKLHKSGTPATKGNEELL